MDKSLSTHTNNFEQYFFTKLQCSIDLIVMKYYTVKVNTLN